MEVAVKNRQRSVCLDHAFVTRILEGALLHLSCIKGWKKEIMDTNIARAEVSVLFVGDRAMRHLNRNYRGVDRTTDVLSFSQLEGHEVPAKQLFLGDIVVSPVKASHQAAERGVTFEEELALLLVHGLLHLLGYDHERNGAEARRMRRKEQELLNALSPLGR